MGTVGGLLDQLAMVNAKDVLSEDQIREHLTDCYRRFDSSRDQKLDKWEFTQAWTFLGLKGTEAEVSQAFINVDTNNSNSIDLEEFITAIMDERMVELSLNH